MTRPVDVALSFYPVATRVWRCNALCLLAIGSAAIIFAPRGFLRIAEQIQARDVIMVAHFTAAQAAEIALCPIRASAVTAVGLFVVDALHFVPASLGRAAPVISF